MIEIGQKKQTKKILVIMLIAGEIICGSGMCNILVAVAQCLHGTLPCPKNLQSKCGFLFTVPYVLNSWLKTLLAKSQKL